MSTEVLLLNDIDKLGKTGDIVKVADGYARNYLLPQGHATVVSNHALKRLEKIRKERMEQARIRLAEARSKAAKLKDGSVTLRAKVIEDNRLYGSISSADIAAAITEWLKIDLDRSQILLDEPLKESGVYDIEIRLHEEVSETVKVWIVED